MRHALKLYFIDELAFAPDFVYVLEGLNDENG